MTLPRGLASYLWCTTQRDLGEYITVLDEREIEGNDGRMTELLLNFWAEESVAEEIRDLLHVSRNGPVGWANDGRLKLVRGSFAELAVFRPEIKRTCRLLYWWIVWEFIWYMSRSPREKWEWRVKYAVLLLPSGKTHLRKGNFVFYEYFPRASNNFLQHFKCKAQCLCSHSPNRLRHCYSFPAVLSNL